MNDETRRRLAALTGIALAAVVAIWWLGSARIALDRGADCASGAAQALHAMWLLRAVVLAMTAVRAGALYGARAAGANSAVLVAPAWPLVVLAASASATPWLAVAAAEAALVLLGVALPLAGRALRGAFARPAAADLGAAGVGVALAALSWYVAARWPLLLS